MLLFGEEHLDSAAVNALPADFHDRLILVSREAPTRKDLHHIKLPFISSRVIRTLEGFDPYLPEPSACGENIPTETDPAPEIELGVEVSSQVLEQPADQREAVDTIQAVDDIEAESEQSENRFSKYDAQIEALRLQQASIEPVSERPYTVLVVDDSAPMQQALAKELQLLEYPVEISFADDGESALAQVGETTFDFIFLDIMMPGIDGFETCTRMRAIPALKKTPIIMLSSKSSPLDEVKGIMAGSSTYLTKPIQPEEFRKVIKRVTRWVSEFKKV
ncbi:MAG: response regulator [Oceanospirillales bacterium]|nr:response regulator [Oceanospirillales bacterium]